MTSRFGYFILITGLLVQVQAFAKPSSAVRTFSLIDANTGEIIEGYEKISEGMEIDLSKLETDSLSIRANTKGQVKSVQFEMDSSYSYLAKKRPFYLCGRKADTVTPCQNLTEGSHKLSADPFSGSNGQGDQ